MEMFLRRFSKCFFPLPEFHLQSQRRNSSKENLFDGIGNCAVGLAVLQRAEMDGQRQLLSVMLSVVQNPGDWGLLQTHFHRRTRAGKHGRGRRDGWLVKNQDTPELGQCSQVELRKPGRSAQGK